MFSILGPHSTLRKRIGRLSGGRFHDDWGCGSLLLELNVLVDGCLHVTSINVRSSQQGDACVDVE